MNSKIINNYGVTLHKYLMKNKTHNQYEIEIYTSTYAMSAKLMVFSFQPKNVHFI